MPLSTYLSLLLQPLILEHLSLRKVKKKKHSRFHSFTKLPQERTMGQDRKCPVYPLGYVNFTQVNRSSFPGQSANFYLACEQSLHLGYIVKSRRVRGDAKARGGASRLRRSLACSRAVRFARPNRRACLQANFQSALSTENSTVATTIQSNLTLQTHCYNVHPDNTDGS